MTDERSVVFVPGEEGAVVAAMEELAGGSGWLTIDPGVEPELLPPPKPALARLLGNSGPLVPRATWVPAQLDRRRPEPVSVGILHASGPRAEARLAEAGIAVPDGWRVVGDHPKRGLVAYVPVDVDHLDVLRWLVRASAFLSRIPLTGDWRATVQRG